MAPQRDNRVKVSALLRATYRNYNLMFTTVGGSGFIYISEFVRDLLELLRLIDITLIFHPRRISPFIGLLVESLEEKYFKLCNICREARGF